MGEQERTAKVEIGEEEIIRNMVLILPGVLATNSSSTIAIIGQNFTVDHPNLQPYGNKISTCDVVDAVEIEK